MACKQAGTTAAKTCVALRHLVLAGSEGRVKTPGNCVSNSGLCHAAGPHLGQHDAGAQDDCAALGLLRGGLPLAAHLGQVVAARRRALAEGLALQLGGGQQEGGGGGRGEPGEGAAGPGASVWRSALNSNPPLTTAITLLLCRSQRLTSLHETPQLHPQPLFPFHVPPPTQPNSYSTHSAAPTACLHPLQLTSLLP